MLWALGITFVVAGLTAIVAWWVMVRMPGASHHGELPPPDHQLVALGNDLRTDVAALAVEIGERNVANRPNQLERAADYIESRFTGYAVRRQEYRVFEARCHNLEVEILGTSRSKEIVIVGAHYDTVPGTPGANDNASGVAAMLALARRFSLRTTDRTLRFVAFVNEEKPYAHTEQMGSRVYARRCREWREDVVAMLSLEMLGCYDDRWNSQKYPPLLSFFYPSRGNFIGFIGNTASRRLVRRVVRTFRQHEPFPSEGAAVPKLIRAAGFSDHWSFWQEGYPAAMVTDTAMFRYPHYHEPEDTIDKIDFNRMARVVRGLEKVISELVGVEKEPGGPANGSQPIRPE